MSEFKYFEFRPHGGVYFDKENADIMFQYMDRLEAERAELRELIQDMYAVISDRNSWWDCMRRDTKHFADHMRELGIEADV